MRLIPLIIHGLQTILRGIGFPKTHSSKNKAVNRLSLCGKKAGKGRKEASTNSERVLAPTFTGKLQFA